MNVTDPILRVSVVSTGQVQIRPDHEASTWRPAAWWLLASRHWTRHDLDDPYLGLHSAPTLAPQISDARAEPQKIILHAKFWYRFMIRIRLAALAREPFPTLA